MKTIKMLALLSAICLMGLAGTGCIPGSGSSKGDSLPIESSSSFTTESPSSAESAGASVADSAVSNSSQEESNTQTTGEKIMRTPIDDDGKGDIHLGMDESNFLAACNKNGVKVEKSPYSNHDYSLGVYEIQFYSDENQLTSIVINDLHPDYPKGCETSRGLKVGDSAKRMIELYGDDYNYETESGQEYYRYYYEGYILQIRFEMKKVVDWSYMFVPESPGVKEKEAQEIKERAERANEAN